jgi:nucleoprotein TPR
MQYDRIDPSEVQSLKDEIAQLQVRKAEVETLLSTRDSESQAQNQRVCVLHNQNMIEFTN